MPNIVMIFFLVVTFIWLYYGSAPFPEVMFTQHFIRDKYSAEDVLHSVKLARHVVLLPLLRAFIGFSAFLSSMVASDRVFHVYISLYWKLFARKKPHQYYVCKQFPSIDYPDEFPNVCVQLPMFNEKEVCQQVIDAACHLEWPKSKLLIQILDDSTCLDTQQRIIDKVLAWRECGMHIVHRQRSNRNGYKAGAMRESMDEITNCEYCAIFDADFDPDPDFLIKTVPYLHCNANVGFVQARWIYSNEAESILTRVQAISLNYHMRAEQYARFAAGLFFNFNGTAGVWRRKAIIDAGGWNQRTTVEDMDLSLRAYLRGWKFVFLDDVTCVNEIPSCYNAFRKQQHRWCSGPMELWRKATAAVWRSKSITFAQKMYLNCFFFGTRLFATHIVSFVFYCLLVPICATAPEVSIPFWALVYMPILVTLSTVYYTPGGWVHALAYVLFENAMSIVKVSAMLAGLLDLKDAHEWVVTTKMGKWVASKIEQAGHVPLKKQVTSRKIYKRELLVGTLFLICGTYGLIVHRLFHYAIFLYFQGVVFLAFGLSFIPA